jgi:hypothetical protein
MSDESAILEKIHADGFETYLNDDDETKAMLYFLYRRKFFEDDNDQRKRKRDIDIDSDNDRRKRDITRILSSKTNAAASDPAITRGPYQRLQTIIQKESDNPMPGEQFIAFCTSMATLVETAYAEDESVITIFKPSQNGGIAIQMVHRSQPAINCYLQAPAVMQCYLVQKGTTKWRGVMNLAQFVRRRLSSKHLSQYVIEDSGGDSKCILSNILQATPVLVAITFSMPASWKYLVEHGPALVSYFRLEQRFLGFQQADAQNPELPYFQGRVNVEYFLDNGTLTEDKRFGKVKRHAMVLVGMRHVDNEWRLLLQNWWENMQFVEVSAEYFISSGARLSWAMEKQTKIPDTVPILRSVYAETFMEGGGGDVKEQVCETDRGFRGRNLHLLR